MEVRFAAHESDALGSKAAIYLRGRGYASRILSGDEQAGPSDIAIFAAQEGSQIRGNYLSLCPYTFADHGIEAPAWAATTPFQAALRLDAPSKWPENYRTALNQLAGVYAAWSPWAEPDAPWSPSWHKGPPTPAFRKWQDEARRRVPPLALAERLGRYLSPVFAPAPLASASTLMVIGCAAFNRPHTDFVDELLPGKMEAVTRHLAGLVGNGGFERVEVVVAMGDILSHAALRSHLHPFIFASVKEAETLVGKPFNEPARLWRRNHRRTDEEIGQALGASASAMQRQLVEPLQHAVGVPVHMVSWLGLVRPYLDEAERLVDQHQSLLEGIYLERVRTRESYATMHAIDAKGGIARTFGNAVLYVAEALYLRDRQDIVLANFEANEAYWQGLAPVVTPLWGEHVPYIGMVAKELRQPWGY